MTILVTHYDLFLVSFMGVSEQFIFDGGTNGILGDLIQQHGKHGINFIKRFDKSKSKFIYMKKETINTLFNFDTHSVIQLQKVNFIK